MAARMAYFRTKWRDLPAAYAPVPGRAPPAWRAGRAGRGPIELAGGPGRGTTRVPARRAGRRRPEDYLRRPRTPAPNDAAPEAEWGAEPGLATLSPPGVPPTAIPSFESATPDHRRFFRPCGRPLMFGTQRGTKPASTGLPCFLLADPWRTLTTASVPFWTFFAVQPALESLQRTAVPGRALPRSPPDALPTRSDQPDRATRPIGQDPASARRQVDFLGSTPNAPPMTSPSAPIRPWSRPTKPSPTSLVPHAVRRPRQPSPPPPPST